MMNKSESILVLLGCALALGSVPATAQTGPDLEIDTAESVILVPRGTVSSNTLSILNNGDAALNWTLTDKVEGKVVKAFENPWTSARSMRYDATRDCLWLSYYYSGDLKKVSTSNGSVLATKSMGSTYTRPYTIEMDGSYLWTANYTNGFIKFNLNNMSVADTVPLPSKWTYACGLAIGDGNWYSTRYNYDYRKHIYRLDPSSGAVQQTFKDVEYFYYSGNHISYGDGAIWFGAYYTPKNVIKKFNPATGKMRSEIEMPDWYTSMYIYDQALTPDGRMWALTYRHDYHESGTYKYWIHLLDFGAMNWLTESADSGTVPAVPEGSEDPEWEDIAVVFDAATAEIGIHRVGIRIESNGGTEEKPYVFVVHAPGANTAPAADAGPNQTHDITEPTMEVTLDGSGSSDPNGDELVYLWTMGPEELSTDVNPTIELPPGVHDIKLTVDDLRGGVDTDTVRITLRAPNIEVDDLYVPIPEGGGTVTVRNTGDRTLNWSVSDTLAVQQSDIVREFQVTWVSSYSAYAYPQTMAYDATRDSLWVGYYNDDEVGRLNANNGNVIETKALGDGKRVYAIDMEGAHLWNADYSEKKFRKFDMDTLANPQTINSPWGTGYGPSAMARDSGQFFAGQYYQETICRLNPSSGNVQATHTTSERNYYRYNGIDAVDGKVWYSRYSTPRNRIHCIDGASGNLLTSVEVSGWDKSAYIYDLSFANSTQCWMLTYNVKGDSKRWAHLVDLSAGARFTKSTGSGSVSAGGTGTIGVSFDVTGLAIGLYPVVLEFASNDPDEPVYQKTIYFLVHEDAPNNPPVADAGPDVTRNIEGLTAAFALNQALAGAGSSDPDGDPLHLSWSFTETGEPLETTEQGLAELGGGAHRLTLTVHDYRGGTNTDEMVFTVNANVPPDGFPQYHGAHRHNPDLGDWLENWPPIERWRVPAGKNHGGRIIHDGWLYDFHQSRFRCYNAETGELRWETDWKKDIINSGYPRHGGGGWTPVWPAVDETYIYTVDGGGVTAAWDKETGANVWQDYPGQDTYVPSPHVYGDIVLGNVYAYNKYTGERLYKHGLSSWGCAAGLDYDGRHWWSIKSNMRDMLTGESVLSLGGYAGYSGGTCPPIQFGGDKVYYEGGVRRIGESRSIWTESEIGESYNSYYCLPTLVDGYAYYAEAWGYKGCKGRIVCVRLSDGKRMWGPLNDDYKDRVNHGGATSASGYIVGDWNGIQVIKADPAGLNSEGRYPYYPDGIRGLGGYGIGPIVYRKKIYAHAEHGGEGSFLVCVDCAYSAPVVDTGDGATWHPDTGSATLHGRLVNTGGKPTTVRVYWGTTDGGTDASAWDSVAAVGPRERGPFTGEASGLATNAVYYYRGFAENELGETWAPVTERFTTELPATTEGENGLVLHWPCDQAADSGGDLVVDISGNGNHGHAEQIFVSVDGPVGRALSLGPGGAICPDLSERLRESWTLAVWVNFTHRSTAIVLSHAPDYSGMNVDWESVFGFRHGHMNDGTWRHIAVVQEDGRRTVYIDGEVVLERSDLRIGDAVAHDTFGSLKSGGELRGDYQMIDDLRVYRRALSHTEIRALTTMCGAAAPVSTVALTSADDAQEAADGTVTLDGAELELGADTAGDPTVVGLRFPNLAIPRGATIHSATIRFRAGGDTNGAYVLLDAGSLGGYGGENQDGTAVITDSGRTITLTSNIWQSHPQAYEIKSGTIMTLKFQASANRCEAHAIGMDSQIASVTKNRMFTLYGGGFGIADYRINSGKSYKPYYRLPIGSHYTGSMSHIVFINDDDNAPIDSWSTFADIRLFEPGPSQTAGTYLTIGAETSDNAAAFTSSSYSLSSRPLTVVKVPWMPAAWQSGADTPDQCTPDLAGLVQAVVDRTGWQSGNAIAFLISGEGRRFIDAAEKAWGAAAELSVTWTAAEDLDRDGLPDSWERASADVPPSTVIPEGDSDGDGLPNWQEYLFGTLGDDGPVLSLRPLPDGRVVACIDGKAADPLFFPGLQRYYTLMHQGTLPTGATGTVSTLWHEDFALADGTTSDSGETAWTIAGAATVALCVTNGHFRCENTDGEIVWRSEPIRTDWSDTGVSIDLQSWGKNLTSATYIKVLYSASGGPEKLLIERRDNFSDNVWQTASAFGALGDTIEIVIRVNAASSAPAPAEKTGQNLGDRV